MKYVIWGGAAAGTKAAEDQPHDIIRYDDIVYRLEPKEQSLDVYRPKSGNDQKLPPVFLMTGTADFLKAQAPVSAAELIKKSIPFVFCFYGDAENKLGHVFHCDIRMEDAQKCNNDECEFFHSYLS